MPSYSLTVLAVYFYLLFATKRLKTMVQGFLRVTQKFSVNFSRFCWLATIACLFLRIAENIMYDLQMVKKSASKQLVIETLLWTRILPLGCHHSIQSSAYHCAYLFRQVWNVGMGVCRRDCDSLNESDSIKF